MSALENPHNNKRIFKNTLFLYIRMLLIMCVGFYTSRVVFATLGEVDYGIQNVVGGFVGVLAFLSSTVSSALSRYFAFEIGRGDKDKLNKYFVLSFIAYTIIAVIVVLLAETVGLWFVQNKMTIPSERMDAALVVYQFAVLGFIMHLFIIPYNSLIIAEEKMNVYAYISILDVVLKLLIVYLLSIGDFDKLKLYAALLFFSTLISQAMYVVYVSAKYKEESRLHLYWNKPMFTNLLSYSGWTLFGTISDVSRGQGLNILINLFFGPVVNAARGLAYFIDGAIERFVSGFYTACRPQITKLYAKGEQADMMRLVFRTSRLCYYLVITLSIPILIELDHVLVFWLHKEPPEYTTIFTQLVIVNAIINSLSYSFITAISAVGKIKWFQIVTGGLKVLTLPIAYVFLKLGYPPQSTLVVTIGITVVAQISRVIFMMRLNKMSLKDYCKDVIARVCMVTIVAFIATKIIDVFIICDNVLMLIVFGVLSVLLTLTIIYILGINREERNSLNNLIVKRFYGARISRKTENS